MKKRFGKLAAIATLGLSAALMVTACGSGEEKESGKIRVFFGDAAGTEVDDVSNAVSEMSKEKIGVEVELVFFGAGEYDQKMPKLMATNEQMDVGWTAGDGFVSNARDGAYYDISKDLSKYPGIKELFTDEFLGGVTIDGGIYGIPTLKEMANNWAAYIDEDTLTALGMKATDVQTIADIEPILAYLKEQGRLGFRIGNTGGHTAFDLEEHFDTITGGFVVSNNKNEKLSDKEVLNYYETDKFEAYVRLLRDWYTKGYISEDILENGEGSYADAVTADPLKSGISYVCYSPLNEVGASRGSKRGNMIPLQITPAVINNSSTRGSVMVVFNKSKNKQSSLKFLELLNTDKDFNRLVKYGIEGKHYTMEEDEDGIKKIQRTEGATGMYLNQNWRSGNMLLGNIEMGEPETKTEVFNEWNETAEKSVVLGFTPDISSLEAEISACSAVVKGKCAALLTGAIDPDDPENGIEAVKNDLKTAGSDKVKSELQKQYLNWIKEK